MKTSIIPKILPALASAGLLLWPASTFSQGNSARLLTTIIKPTPADYEQFGQSVGESNENCPLFSAFRNGQLSSRGTRYQQLSDYYPPNHPLPLALPSAFSPSLASPRPPFLLITACFNKYSICPFTLRNSSWAQASSSAQSSGSIRNKNGLRAAMHQISSEKL
jgi:hypothetical protein